MKEKNYFQFYQTFFETIEALPESVQPLFYRAICRYGLFDEDPDFENLNLANPDYACFLRSSFTQIKFALDYQKERRRINRENGKAYGASKATERKTKRNEATFSEHSQIAEVKVEVKDEVEEKVKAQEEDEVPSPKKSSRFKKPTVEETRAYCIERGNTVDPQQFFDYYEANGWMVGKSHMKDWKSAVRNWERNQGKFDGGRKKSAQSNQEIIKANWGENEIPESLF